MNVSISRLPEAVTAWGTSDFADTLKSELENLAPDALPLQQGLSHGSYVSGDQFEVMILTVSESPGMIHARVGIHYFSIIAGCNCADDPTPVDELHEYCEVEIELDKATAEARVRLLVD
ncbi:hypothetical protein [Thiohalomonas denitrificans]|uniref:Uncharacterized protein n=1 Tax=Thiohalomonas denitrificans TaxID=415747 RepID=A0A1G5QC50_9GAMM|nr:hypothetical protein [Thiohalomonas denitrificans]SCZ59277.1 hypothetical protein SAMN03097708_01829 [Thiohalomonas denitrificans]